MEGKTGLLPEPGFIPEFAVLGHPNEGKSSVVSTLAEDDSVRISPTPGETTECRTFPVRVDGRELICFTDTPGFQLPRRALSWMQAYDGPEKDPAVAFCNAHRDRPEFRNECQLLTPVARGAGIIFVVDGSRPVRENDRAEMEILRLTGRPRMAIINTKVSDQTYLNDWKDAFRKSFNSIRVFNAHNASYAERIALLESLKAIDQDWQPVLAEVIEAFRRDWHHRNRQVADILCELIAKCLQHMVRQDYAELPNENVEKENLIARYQSEIAALEKAAQGRIRRLFKHNIFNLELPPYSVVNAELFNRRTWKLLGLKPAQLAAVSAAGGGLIGAKLDLLAAGLTFGVFTALGGAMGAGAAYLFGEQAVRAKVVGLRIGGYQVRVGPSRNLQFPFVLLDRGLLYYAHTINWAHGRREATGDAGSPDLRELSPETNTILTAAWNAARKKVCSRFFNMCRVGRSDESAVEARAAAAKALLEVLDSISAGPVLTV